jgi:hypothetical protein
MSHHPRSRPLVTSSRTAAVFEDHLLLRRRWAVGEDLDRNYSDEVVPLTGFGLFRGKDGARRPARMLHEQLPRATYESRTKLTDGEAAFLGGRPPATSAPSVQEDVR